MHLEMRADVSRVGPLAATAARLLRLFDADDSRQNCQQVYRKLHGRLSKPAWHAWGRVGGGLFFNVASGKNGIILGTKQAEQVLVCA